MVSQGLAGSLASVRAGTGDCYSQLAQILIQETRRVLTMSRSAPMIFETDSKTLEFEQAVCMLLAKAGSNVEASEEVCDDPSMSFQLL
jgi:hypothetical protein